jgi:hypothetical protein
MFDDLLLLKKGGQVTYHGPLGKDSRTLIGFFESKGATPIELGDNPANWILRVMQDEKMGDLANMYKDSVEFVGLQEELATIAASPEPDTMIEYDSEFATSRTTPDSLLNHIHFHSILASLRPSPTANNDVNDGTTTFETAGDTSPSISSDEPKTVERVELPIDKHEEMILENIQRNRVTIIHGETGCGQRPSRDVSTVLPFIKIATFRIPILATALHRLSGTERHMKPSLSTPTKNL